MDKGPWGVFVSPDDKVCVRSGDFEHDVILRILGDFAGYEQRYAYAEWLAAKLNGSSPTGEELPK